MLIILGAIFLRTFFIWIGRPEFVGWFNHTYYYYVQTEGLLESGVLPFPDMPLLFYIYSFTAKLFIATGLEMHTAIVSASRFWMCIIPSLILIPIYFLIKEIGQEKLLSKEGWILIFFSVMFIYFIDVQRYQRLLFYIRNSFESSFFGTLLSTTAAFNLKSVAFISYCYSDIHSSSFYKDF